MFNYEKLPDGTMDYEDIRRCYIEFLFDYQKVAADNDMLEQLLEIAERGMLELLEESVINAISDFILNNINYEDFEIMETIASIVPGIGLKNVWEVILSKKASIKNMEVVKLIEECDEEYGEHVEDPHWDLREYINKNLIVATNFIPNYKNLPDRMPPEEIRRCYIEFLFDYQKVTADKKMYAFEQLLEISKREMYELLDETVINALSDFILSHIDYENFDMMSKILSIIPSLGLKSAWKMILSKKASIKNVKVIKLIEECDEEYGGHVGDPYWELREWLKV